MVDRLSPNNLNPISMPDQKKAVAKPTRLDPTPEPTAEKVEPTVKQKVTPNKLGSQPKVHGPTFGSVTAIYH